MRATPEEAVPAIIRTPAKADRHYIAKEHERKPGGCQYCDGRKFVRSGLRSEDAVHLLMLRYPARCTRCGRRQFVSFLTAAISKTMAERASRQPKIRQNWRQWTSESDKPIIESLQRIRDPREAHKHT